MTIRSWHGGRIIALWLGAIGVSVALVRFGVALSATKGERTGFLIRSLFVLVNWVPLIVTWRWIGRRERDAPGSQGQARQLNPLSKSPLPALPVLAFTLLTSVGAAQQLPSFKTRQDVDAFAQTYYQRPRPELIGGLIEALDSTGLMQKANAVAPYVGFFSEVFAANPALLPEWQALIAKQDESVRVAFKRAVAVSKAGGVIAIEGHSASINDMYWGAFFASGRAAFVQKLVDQLRYFDERDDLTLFMAGATAKWSLASNAESHPLVRSTLGGPTLVADQRTRDIIGELLAQGPVRVKQDTADIVRRQREAGKWR